MGASPDGLVYDSKENLIGIIKVKCLKALKDQTATQWMNKGIPTSACVSPSNGSTLKSTQVQLQLLVTEIEYCDFVLHSKVGQPCIIRIFIDVNLQRQIP